MKRLFTIFTVCCATFSLVSCGTNYKERAHTWLSDNTEHFVCLDKERHSLYHFNHNQTISKVDLNDFSWMPLNSIDCEGDVTYNFDNILGYGLPADKGYEGSNSFALAVEDYSFPNNERQAGIIYNTYGQPSKLICKGFYVDVHNYNLFSSAYLTNGSISGVDVFDIEGNKLTPKQYAGTIAKQSVIVELVEKDGILAGSYYYTKYGPGKHRIYIFGSVNKDREFEIYGYNYYYGSKYNCEGWSGTFKNGTFEAEAYIHHTHRSYDFILTEIK